MPKETIVDLIEASFEARKNKTRISDKEMFERLLSLGINNDKINDLIIKIDDEWTNEEFQIAQLRNAKQGLIGGYVIFFLGIFITLITYFGLYNGNGIIFFYGAIASGLVSIFYSQSLKKKIETSRRKRKVIWKSWC